MIQVHRFTHFLLFDPSCIELFFSNKPINKKGRQLVNSNLNKGKVYLLKVYMWNWMEVLLLNDCNQPMSKWRSCNIVAITKVNPDFFQHRVVLKFGPHWAWISGVERLRLRCDKNAMQVLSLLKEKCADTLLNKCLGPIRIFFPYKCYFHNILKCW